MRQTSSLTRKLTESQERAAGQTSGNGPAWNAAKTLFRFYTQNLASVDYTGIIGRYFAGATIYQGIGLDARTQEDSENAIIIEIVSSLPDALQRAVFLAGDLRHAGNQISVLLTVQDIRTFELTEAEPKRVAGSRLLDRPSDSPRYVPGSRAQSHRFPV